MVSPVVNEQYAVNSDADGFRISSARCSGEWLGPSYLELVAAIIRSGLKVEGADYLQSHGGRYWCWVGDLDPDAVMRVAAKHNFNKHQKYHRAQSVPAASAAR